MIASVVIGGLLFAVLLYIVCKVETMRQDLEDRPEAEADARWWAQFQRGPTVNLDNALATVKDAGYVVLREKSYRAAQERQRQAEAARDYAIECERRTDRWAHAELWPEIRRLHERLTFVYGVARAHGVTVEELRQ